MPTHQEITPLSGANKGPAALVFLWVVAMAWSWPTVGHAAPSAGATSSSASRGGRYARLLRQLHSRNPRLAARARRALRRAGARAFAAIVRAFSTPSLGARRRLLALLPKPNKSLLRSLAHAIRRGKGTQRSGAMYALSELMRHPPPQLLGLLLWRLRRGPWYVRGAAAYALSRARQTPRVRKALLRALRDHSWRVKGNAAAGLRRAGARARSALRKAQHHKHWTVQATARALLTPSAHRLVASQKAPKKQPLLKVATYNICHGEGMDGSYSLRRIARILRRSRADIIGLQEVDQGTRRSLKHHQLKRLAKMLKMHAVFGPAIAFKGGRFGNGLLSRFRIAKHTIHKLKRLGGWEERSIIDATIALPGGRTIRVFNTHLDNRSAKARGAAVKRLRQLVGTSTTPAILLGDLNASPQSPTLQQLGKHWYNPLARRPLASMPATVPIFQIDYVMVRPKASWRFVSAHVDRSPLARLASDHRPLFVTLALPPHTTPKRRP